MYILLGLATCAIARHFIVLVQDLFPVGEWVGEISFFRPSSDAELFMSRT